MIPLSRGSAGRFVIAPLKMPLGQACAMRMSFPALVAKFKIFDNGAELLLFDPELPFISVESKPAHAPEQSLRGIDSITHWNWPPLSIRPRFSSNANLLQIRPQCQTVFRKTRGGCAPSPLGTANTPNELVQIYVWFTVSGLFGSPSSVTRSPKTCGRCLEARHLSVFTSSVAR
jgi:hypothetical protein